MPQDLSEMPRDEDFVEGQKLAYDAFKHLTTISTGVIILLATLLKEFFTNPVWKGLIVWIFICFITTVFCSVIMMFIFCITIVDRGEIKGKVAPIVAYFGFGLSAISFIAGIIIFTIFAVKNFN